MLGSHFISASCSGERCRCGVPATHKVGEEIPRDEPCLRCGESWRKPTDGRGREWKCLDWYHWGGEQRHNLTAYVCCACFIAIVGEAAPCPR